MMKKYIARQVPPEEQEPASMDWIEFRGDIAIFGNDNFCEIIPDRVKAVMDQLARADLLNWKEAHEAGERYFWGDWNSLEEAARDCYPELDSSGCGILSRRNYTAEEINALMLCEDAYCGNGDPDAIARAMSIIFRETWTARTIRGSSQSDWSYMLTGPAVTDSAAREAERQYFGEFEEWYFIDEIGAACSVFCFAYDDEGKRKEIADAIGCRPEAVEMYEFKGYERRAVYERIESEREEAAAA